MFDHLTDLEKVREVQNFDTQKAKQWCKTYSANDPGEFIWDAHDHGYDYSAASSIITRINSLAESFDSTKWKEFLNYLPLRKNTSRESSLTEN